MGWYSNEMRCPNCKLTTATETHRSSGDEEYYLICLYCEEKCWVISQSYIDTNVIGKNLKDIAPEEIFDINRENEDILKRGSLL